MSISLAKRYNAIVVNADSMQVYKYLNIGTAKVTEEEKDGWLIDASRGKYNAYFLSALQGGVFPTLGIDNIDRPYVHDAHARLFCGDKVESESGLVAVKHYARLVFESVEILRQV